VSRRSLGWSTVPALLAVSLLACGSSNVGGGASTPSQPAQSGSTSAASTGTAPATSAATQSGTLDVCALATQSDVDTAAGASLGAAVPQPPPDPGASKCSWPGSGPPVGGLVEPGITIAVVPLPAGTSATSLPMFNGQVPNARHISGVGDAAVALAPGQLGPTSVQIFVATHGSLLTLSLVYSGAAHTANPVQSMTTLAQTVIGRYP